MICRAVSFEHVVDMVDVPDGLTVPGIVDGGLIAWNRDGGQDGDRSQGQYDLDQGEATQASESFERAEISPRAQHGSIEYGAIHANSRSLVESRLSVSFWLDQGLLIWPFCLYRVSAHVNFVT